MFSLVNFTFLNNTWLIFPILMFIDLYFFYMVSRLDMHATHGLTEQQERDSDSLESKELENKYNHHIVSTKWVQVVLALASAPQVRPIQWNGGQQEDSGFGMNTSGLVQNIIGYIHISK
ncbi:hypothetical protein ACJX0J_035328 [Zea mays]